jgi:hypothetical protein
MALSWKSCREHLMLLLDITCWFFTESHFREHNPFERFERERLMGLQNDWKEIPPENIGALRNEILERTEEIFESDLSWGQNIYSRPNLRWSSFLAAYYLTISSHTKDPADCLKKTEEMIYQFGRTKRMRVWSILAKAIFHKYKVLPRRLPMGRINVARFLRHTNLPYTSQWNMIDRRDTFYERFFKLHSCPELNDVFIIMSGELADALPPEVHQWIALETGK